MIEVGGEGVAESSAGSRAVVAGEGGGVGGHHDARVGEQRPVGRVGLDREHVEAEAGEEGAAAEGAESADAGAQPAAEE